ncbi:MAG: DNA topoisomerase III [Proteobacteria bacterium]|nr:DNA topoisomerase III [Pseudomonadota bacterium]
MRLFLCEKPSQGRDIARVLGAGQRGTGCCRGQGVVVTWCIGHLLEAEEPEAYGEQYKKWSLEQLPIIPPAWKMAPKHGSLAQYRVVRDLLREATELVIATDADREGEMIARELLEHCGYRRPVQRLWLSALNDASIRQALGSLKPGAQTLPLYHAALARSRADWLVGMNFTRLFTLLGQRSGYSGVLSVGRVQTPTLRLVVERDRLISGFVPVPFWAIGVMLSHDGARFLAQWLPPEGTVDEAGRCLKVEVANAAHALIRSVLHAKVTSVEVERIKQPPPLPFDLSTLQTACSNRLGLDVQETLDIAQALYETHKATTYPRTDTGYLPSNMFAEVPAVVKALVQTDPEIAPLVKRLDLTRRSRAWDDAKVTAHHGIIPTLEPTRFGAMNDKERAVYALIRSHFLAQFLPHHEFDRTTAMFECGGETLRATGKRVVAPGWHLAMGAANEADSVDTGEGKAQNLPPLAQGASCRIVEVEMKALETSPPRPYTQGELVADMKGIARRVTDPQLKQKLKETTGIGTEATRAGIISGLLARGFLAKRGKSIISTGTASALIDALPAPLSDPCTTAIWEQALDLIATGQMEMALFLSRQSEWVAQLVNHFRASPPTLSLPVSTVPQRKGGSTKNTRDSVASTKGGASRKEKTGTRRPYSRVH